MPEKTSGEAATTLMEFPCKFTIKTMGLANKDFSLIATEIVRQHAPELDHQSVESKLSKTGKYISISITINAQNKQQMDAIYQDLTDCEHVLMSL